MKNKYGLIGLLSLFGFWGLYSGDSMFLSFFTFIIFFQYLWIIPDEFFIETLRKSAAIAFFANIAITSGSAFLLSFFEISNNPIAAGTSFGFGVAIFIFVLLSIISEWRERRGNKDD